MKIAIFFLLFTMSFSALNAQVFKIKPIKKKKTEKRDDFLTIVDLMDLELQDMEQSIIHVDDSLMSIKNFLGVPVENQGGVPPYLVFHATKGDSSFRLPLRYNMENPSKHQMQNMVIFHPMKGGNYLVDAATGFVPISGFPKLEFHIKYKGQEKVFTCAYFLRKLEPQIISEFGIPSRFAEGKIRKLDIELGVKNPSR